jgi:hypothetical protein
MQAIKSQAIITSLSAKADGSLGIRLTTPELSPDEKVAFMELQNVNIEAWFKPTDDSVKDIIEVKSEVDRKSPSQRLRGVLFVLWEQEGRNGDFTNFYNTKMENIINHLKSKLED